jgi:hypothetical protein
MNKNVQINKTLGAKKWFMMIMVLSKFVRFGGSNAPKIAAIK